MHRRVRGCCRFQGQGRVSRVGRDGDRRVPTFRLFNDVGTKRCEEGRVYTEVRNAEVATAGSCVGKVPAWLIQMGRGMPRRMCGTMGGPKFNKLGKKNGSKQRALVEATDATKRYRHAATRDGFGAPALHTPSVRSISRDPYRIREGYVYVRGAWSAAWLCRPRSSCASAVDQPQSAGSLVCRAILQSAWPCVAGAPRRRH